mgnify:CR=1 FL=1
MTVIRKYILAPDALGSYFVLLLGFLYVDFQGVEPVYELSKLSISIVTLLFSIFLAAFSIVAASASDDFIVFIEERGGVFHRLMYDFRFNMSILMFVLLFNVAMQILERSKFFYIIFIYNEECFTILSGLLVYALLSCSLLAYQVVHFSVMRGRHLRFQRKKEENKDT